MSVIIGVTIFNRFNVRVSSLINIQRKSCRFIIDSEAGLSGLRI